MDNNKTVLTRIVLVLSFAAPLIGANPNSALSAGNPFGLMIGGGSMSVNQRVDLAKASGVARFRPWDVNLSEWGKRLHEDAEPFQRAGLKLILTVRNNGGGQTQAPTTAPENLEAYKSTLEQVLRKLRPELLVVENEENSKVFWIGTAQQYGAELKAACEVAHRMGIKCTNGGMVSLLAAGLTWNHYRERGERAKADSFAKRAFTDAQQRMLSSPGSLQGVKQAVEQGKILLRVYKAAGIDYVNFHWYIPDTQALGETVAFLRSETGLQPLTNEIGQRDTDPNTVQQLMTKVLDLQLPYAVWFSLDRAEAKALQEPDGRLRENGKAFRTFMQQHFGTGGR